jgi:Cytotoxic translational repressor of toxin-antitoxin stability system
MTTVGAGGVVITGWRPSKRYSKEYRKLTDDLRARVDAKLTDLQQNPRPPGLGFEKLKGHPDIYTIHVTGNYKISFDIEGGSIAFLRRVAPHDEIDRAP